MWSQGQSEGMRKLSLADFAITNLYVDEVDENKLVEDAIRGMLLWCFFRVVWVALL